MDSTHTHAQDPVLHQHLVLGETLFVAGAILAFLSDVLLTFRALVLPSALGVVLGLVFIGGTLCVLNMLYTGQKQARQPALIWIALQAGLTAFAVAILLSRNAAWASGSAETIDKFVPSIWLGIFKVAAYGLFGYLISQRTPALFFLRHKGGETVEVPTPTTTPLEDVTPSGVAVPLTPAETQTVTSLAGTLKCAGAALLAAGVFQALAGLRIAPRTTGWIEIGEGVVLLLLGLCLLMTERPVRNVAERGADSNLVIDSLSKLSCLFTKQIVLVLALIGLSIAGIAVRWR